MNLFLHNWKGGARGSVVGWGTMLQAGRSRVRVPMRWKFSSFQPHYGPGVNSASNRNEYQEPSWGVKGGRHVRLKTLPPPWRGTGIALPFYLYNWEGNIMNITMSAAFTQFMWRVKTVKCEPKFSIPIHFCKGLQYYQKQSDKLTILHAYTQMQQCSQKYTLWNGPAQTSIVDM
jgi:hypothetical protein